MPKFFVSRSQVTDKEIKIVGQDVNHIKNVLRLNMKDELLICIKETGQNYKCDIEKIDKDFILCNKINEILETTESNINIHIFQGLPKADKMELIIEKSTEIGVKEITPVVMQRTIVKLDDKDKEKKILRWRKIAEVASKQSGRDIILKVNNIINFENIFKNLEEYDIVLIAYEKEKNVTLKSILKNIKKSGANNIAVIIGPEGGITDLEINRLKELKNSYVVTLGNRILRTETAPLVISSNIFYELEE